MQNYKFILTNENKGNGEKSTDDRLSSIETFGFNLSLFNKYAFFA